MAHKWRPPADQGQLSSVECCVNNLFFFLAEMVMYFKTTHNDLIWVTIFRLKEALENSVLPKLFLYNYSKITDRKGDECRVFNRLE